MKSIKFKMWLLAAIFITLGLAVISNNIKGSHKKTYSVLTANGIEYTPRAGSLVDFGNCVEFFDTQKKHLVRVCGNYVLEERVQ